MEPPIDAPRPSVDALSARHAIERLRSGLFDPVTVRLLTTGADRLGDALEPVLQGRAPHLCICGAYGQGKSHSLRWAMERALKRGFAVSLISLDPREIPLHRPRVVYRALLQQLRLPGEDAGGSGVKALISRWQAFARSRDTPPEALIPEQLPRLHRLILAALARQTLFLDDQQRRQKQHKNYRPRRFPVDLRRALQGDPVPLPRVRHALRYRQVPDRRGGTLAWRGPAPMVGALDGLARLMQDLGMSGWVLLFDEGESIALARPASRGKAYEILEGLSLPAARSSGLCSIFAFTEEILWRLEQERPDLAQRLALYRLRDLSAEAWSELSTQLIHLHGQAHCWRPGAEAPEMLQQRWAEIRAGETRRVLVALVDALDLLEQEQSG